ncbi:SPFH domain-containing protein [Carboxylicivirga sp. RSCT41]|uniref:SPFH domain-containing protein n=1 Tax=Carboxylicivirga agarovorans TaxID=3417570 RepID=UPI003D334E87
MTTFLGFLVLVLGLAAIVVSKLEKQSSKLPQLLKGIKPLHGNVMLVIGVILMLLNSLFFFADRGFNYLLVSPTGHMSAVMEQGIKWRGFAKIDKWQKYIDVKVVSKSTESDLDELEGVMNPIPVRFIDQVTAQGHVSLRFQLPEDSPSFIKLAVKYRTMSNLVNNTIIPTVREQLINTGYMFAAQNYISGEAQAFRQTFEEQLKEGTYAVNKLEVKDTIYDAIDMTSSQRTIKEIQTSYRVEKILLNGIPKRIPHELSENNIIVSQVIVDKIDLEPTFKQRLEAQRDESAKRQLEQQMIETAKAEQQRIVAQGERDKAEERVNQEKEQVKALIAIETKLKQEETNKKLAAIALETERLNAQKKKVTADAEAYEIAKKVNAGITPEVKLAMELDRDVKVAAEIAKIKFPETMIISGDEKGGTPLESLIGAAMAKQLQTSKGN